MANLFSKSFFFITVPITAVVAYWLLFHATSVYINFPTFLFLMFAITLALSLPISIGGWWKKLVHWFKLLFGIKEVILTTSLLSGVSLLCYPSLEQYHGLLPKEN